MREELERLAEQTGLPALTGGVYVCRKASRRIAELEAALNDCLEIASSDSEHEACAGVIKVATITLGDNIRSEE